MGQDNGDGKRENEVIIGKEVSEFVLKEIGWKSKRAVRVRPCPAETSGFGATCYIVFADRAELKGAGVPLDEAE